VLFNLIPLRIRWSLISSVPLADSPNPRSKEQLAIGDTVNCRLPSEDYTH